MAIPEEKMYPRTGGRRSTDAFKQGNNRYRTKKPPSETRRAVPLYEMNLWGKSSVYTCETGFHFANRR